ncbi:bifunctional serine/threonine protein kinase/MFS transporter [candidate division KSB1 bacterium]|nr:bifunctional serine/threonine protein kinase/MFS transporter [candidate division KSB1 bacterium]
MTAKMFTCPSCLQVRLISEIEANNYACLNQNCILSERLAVHAELNPKGQVTRLYGWVLEPGELLGGKYEIVRLIGKGGYGVTYEAKHRELMKQTYAIKETPRLYWDDEEDEFLMHLNHPGIPKLYERFNLGDLHYIIMEYIQGESLQEIVKNRPKRGLEQLILKIVEQACEILSYVHSEGVVHRDLKPENILVRRNGSIAIVDFGIAKRLVPGTRTRHLARAASHFYSPPEQYETGKGVTDPRSDIYSLGAILYFLLTGREPIDAINRKADEVISPLPRELNPDLSSQVEAVIIKAMAMRAVDRYENMIQFKKVLIGAGAVSARVCSKCGQLYRGSRDVCQKCGGPTNPLGQAQTDPFVFRSGSKAANLHEFIDACYQHWQDAIWHLYQGDFEPWLNSIQEGALAERSSNIRRFIENRNLGLNQFLMSSPYARPPKLILSHDKLDFIAVKAGTQKRTVLTIQNSGHGYLQGELQFSSPYLTIDNYIFSCFAGERKHITFTVTTENVPAHRTIKTSVTLETNVGPKTLPVTISAETQAIQWKLAPTALFFELEENETDVKGFTIEVVTSHGKLTGTVESGASWMQLNPTTFNGRSQIIRVEVDSHGLAPAEYQAPIEVKTNIGRKTLDVKLVIEPTITQQFKKVTPWKKIILTQLFPTIFLLILMLIICELHPAKPDFGAGAIQVFLFMFFGILLGSTRWLRRRLKNWIIGMLVGCLAGLILSGFWNPLAFWVDQGIKNLLLNWAPNWSQVALSPLKEIVIYGFSGSLIGGLLGWLTVTFKFKLSLANFLMAGLVFIFTTIFLVFILTLSLTLLR